MEARKTHNHFESETHDKLNKKKIYTDIELYENKNSKTPYVVSTQAYMVDEKDKPFDVKLNSGNFKEFDNKKEAKAYYNNRVKVSENFKKQIENSGEKK